MSRHGRCSSNIVTMRRTCPSARLRRFAICRRDWRRSFVMLYPYPLGEDYVKRDSENREGFAACGAAPLPPPMSLVGVVGLPVPTPPADTLLIPLIAERRL